MSENKQQILDYLLKAIQATRAGIDVSRLEFDSDREYVYVYFGGSDVPSRIINVVMDSGIAMLRDVLRQIDIG